MTSVSGAPDKCRRAGDGIAPFGSEPADDIYDEASVQLFDESMPASPFFRSAPRWSNLTQASSWTPFSFAVNVASVAGKQMVFRIIADLDTSVPTYFYFDTLSIAVTRCSS